ncbi:DNA repair protein [Scheffersomyces xylosifermentans]|uniref:DNA repair protein n=1 Tax=Scheffersomyces xylosifermentans TaxID=1304137 RepID=UPI00315C724A
MSSLFKLSIKGIRSFEPENEETIQFGFPLTLICGQNGCGKTTIIECLKYVTTGDLPPNSKGGAFVNDPSISGRPVVTGQIKLAFRNANGKSMISTRTVSLTRKQARGGVFTNTFKTLEGQLATIDKGNKVSISTKNAELDTQTPIYLGASPAILDYVIFCHQDESLWPLSEASVLKKRFDDIFEASKFTKVLENLKTIKKDMGVDIKLIEQSVKHLKIDKSRAKKIEDKLAEMNNSVEQFTEDISEINLKIEAKEKEAEELFASNQEFQRVLSDFESLKLKKRSLQENIERTKGSIELLKDTDEELLDQQTNFGAITEEKESQIKALQISNSELNQELKNKTAEYNELIRLEGSLKAKETQYEENLESLREIIESNQDNLDFKSSGDIASDIVKYKSKLEQAHKATKSEFKKISNDFQSVETEIQKSLQEVLDSITREEQHQEYCSNDIQSSKKKLASLKSRVEIANSDESELELKRADLESSTTKLDEKKGNNEIRKLDTRIQDNKDTLSKLEFEVEEIAKKIGTSNKQSDVRTRITLLEESLVTKNKYLQDAVSATSVLFKKNTREDLVMDTCETVLDKTLTEVVKEFEKQQKKVVEISGESESTSALIRSSESSKKQYEKNIAELKEKILKVIEEGEIDSYESVVEDLEESYRNVMEDVNTSEVTRQFNITAISIAEKEKHCLLCKRSFDTTALKKFVDELQRSVKQDKIKETEDQAKEIRTELDSVKSINSFVLTYRDSLKQLKEIESTLEKLNSTWEEQKFDLDTEQESLEELRIKRDECTTLKKPLGDIIRLRGEIKGLETQMSELQEEIEGFGTAVLSISELQKLSQSKSSQIKTLREAINDDSEAKFDLQREIQRSENKVKDIKLAISTLERSLADITNLKTTINEVESNISSLESKFTDIKSSLASLYEKRDLNSKELADIRSSNLSILEEKKSILDGITDRLDKFNVLAVAVKEFETKDLARVQENAEAVAKVKEFMETFQKDISNTNENIRELEKAVADSARIQHNIIANIDYRGQLRKLEETENDIQALDISNAQFRKEEYHEKSRKLRQETTDLTSEHAGKIGEVKQIKDQIRTLQKELATDYKNVNENYHEEWIKLQTNLLVSNDIQTYSKALDNAIMKYHSIKMEDINRILGELWSQTYKGSDISTIAIKSDVNLQAKGNRSYNYRVVMYKNSNELDMRGRCSAGQKVLASILIRLALAECFGINCGIIALDEPTTNLDHENSESLAEALNNIIEYRKSQRNFQLIVITHDENFLTHINGGKFTDHFYRVQRDEQQNSRIYSLPISKIQED